MKVLEYLFLSILKLKLKFDICSSAFVEGGQSSSYYQSEFKLKIKSSDTNVTLVCGEDS